MLGFEERLRTSARFDVVGVGEASADEIWVLPETPVWGSKARAARRERLGGGQVATALVACRRLGLSAAWLGKVGDDAAGRGILEGLEREGVDVNAAKVVSGARSRQTAILVDAKGERTVIAYEDPETLLAAGEVPFALAAAGKVLHVDGSSLEASIAAAQAARSAGRVVTCDLERVEPLTVELLKLVDVCITTRDVPVQLTGGPHVDHGLRALKAYGPAIACVTLGAQGAAALTDQLEFHLPAARAPKMVDTTACGDTFRAGFIAALLDGRDLRGCLAFANAAAALKARDLGRRGCPTRAEVEAHLSS